MNRDLVAFEGRTGPLLQGCELDTTMLERLECKG